MGRFRQPGDPGYYTPDETFASTEPVDNLIASGYMLSPEQEAALTPEQAAQYYTAYSNIRQDNQNTHNAGINAAWAQGFSSPETAPRPSDARRRTASRRRARPQCLRRHAGSRWCR